MIIQRLRYSISQRRFWSGVRRRYKEWSVITQGKLFHDFTLPSGFKMKLEVNNALSPHIYSGGFEWMEREWLASHLHSGSVFYDVGANVGFITLECAKLCSSAGLIVSFEPVSGTFSRLQENINLNRNDISVKLFQLALSDKNEFLTMHLSENGKDAWNSLAGTGSAVETIETVALDNVIVKENLPGPDVIKIDVEGWEEHVLKGAEKTIAQFKPLMLIEFTAENLLAAGSSCLSLSQKLSDMNYELFEYDPRSGKEIAVTDFDFSHKNLIARAK